MLSEIGRAAALIFLAELGDKTQILAMTFALHFSVAQVLTGVALGSLLNHGVAVIIGAYLAHVIPLSAVRLSSALLFLAFGLWNLRSGDEDEHHNHRMFTSPVLVVALAFFLGELGDKTQLTAIALASNAQFPWAVLAGTVLGMVLTSLAAIVVGSKLGERIPEFALKLISSAVFIGFGLFHLVQTVPPELLTLPNAALFSAVLLGAIMYLAVPLFKARKLALEQTGTFATAARQLNALDWALNELCLHEETCRNQNCPVGYCKQLIKEELYRGGSEEKPPRTRFQIRKPYVRKGQVFNTARIDEVLKLLEKADLSPGTYREVKENLEKLRP